MQQSKRFIPKEYALHGQRLGEAIARSFSVEAANVDGAQEMQLQPIPDCFICPISCGVMTDPVATVDGCMYERSQILQWFQRRRPVTSPATGLELDSELLMPVVTLQKAIETYLRQRLQEELLEKQALHASVVENCRHLQARADQLEGVEAANEALRHELEELRRQGADQLQGAEAANGALRHELEELRRQGPAEVAAAAARAAPAASGGAGALLINFVGALPRKLRDQAPDCAAEFRIVLDRTAGQALGLNAGSPDDAFREKFLPIKEVMTSGLVRQWNDDHPDVAIKPGDRIVEVNGIRNNAHQILEECGRDAMLELVVERGQELPKSLARNLQLLE